MDLFLSTIPAKGDKPSFFELLMHQQIDDTIKPSIRHIVTSIASRQPLAIDLVDYFDEFYLLLSSIWERRSLLNHDATLAERLYGLKRVPVSDGASRQKSSTSTPPPSGSSKSQKLLSFALAIFVPYVKAKLDGFYQRLRTQQQEQTRRLTAPEQLFLRWYRYFHACFEGAFVLFQLSYLFDLTPCYTPILRLLGLKLVRASSTSSSQQPATTTASELPQTPTEQSRTAKVLSALRTALIVGLLSYRVVIWLMNSSSTTSSHQTAGGTALVPPPPEPAQVAAGGVIPPAEPMKCPLCRSPCRMPAASPGGYVFCYRCLLTHVRQDPTCPVTKLPCTEASIVRLYEQT